MTTPADDLERRRSGEWPPRARRRPPRFPPEWSGDEAYPHVVDLRDELFRSPVPRQRGAENDDRERSAYSRRSEYQEREEYPDPPMRTDRSGYPGDSRDGRDAPPPAAGHDTWSPGRREAAAPPGRYQARYQQRYQDGPDDRYQPAYQPRYAETLGPRHGYEPDVTADPVYYLPAFPERETGTGRARAADIGDPPRGIASGAVDGIAVAGFVTAVLGVTWPVGIALSAFGIARTGPGGLPGRRLAVAGLVTSLAWVVVSLVVAIALAVTNLPRDPATTAGEAAGAGRARADAGPAAPAAASGAAIGDLTLGTCFQDPPSSQAQVFDRVRVVPCTQTHDNEVVAVFDLADRPWPGEAAVTAEANDTCLTEGAAVLTAAAVDPDPWAFYVYYPTRSAWESAGDRTVQCVAYSTAGPTTVRLAG